MIQEVEIPAEVRAAFAAGPGDEPELRLTAEQVVAAGRRRLRRRRALGTGAAAVAVAGVLATASAVLPGPPAGGGSPAAAGPTASTRPSRPAVISVPNLPPESEATRLHRLTAALQAVVNPPAGGRLERAESFRPGLGALQFVASQGGYKAAADERDPLGRGSLFVEVDFGSDVHLPEPCAGAPSCTARRTAAGDLITTSTQRQDGTITYVVDLQRVDGTQVLLMASNYAQDSVPQGKDAPPVTAQRPTPPWTAEQLARIGLTGDLRVD
jgi:hypothetical protein